MHLSDQCVIPRNPSDGIDQHGNAYRTRSKAYTDRYFDGFFLTKQPRLPYLRLMSISICHILYLAFYMLKNHCDFLQVSG